MNKKDKVLMEKYGITSASRTVFFYKEFRYEDLNNAVKYAEHEAKNLALRTTVEVTGSGSSSSFILNTNRGFTFGQTIVRSC